MNKLITQVNVIDKEWKERLTEYWWATNYKGLLPDSMKVDKLLKLRDILIAYGGEECCLPYGDEDIDKILKRGELFIPEPINRKQYLYAVEYEEIIGEPIQCHANSAELYWNNKNKEDYNIRICTGYALTDDGMWRQHSWIVLIDKFNNEVDTVIETTLKRVAYYGVVLTTEECEEFCSNYNWL